MNSKKNGDLRCSKKSAFKTVKGFTLLELIVAIAIISILAGISSVLVTGFIRDANVESMNTRAQQLYASVQNMLIECEIKNDVTCLDPVYVSNENSATGDAKITGSAALYYVYLELCMDNGEITASKTKISNGTDSVAYDDDTKSFTLLNRYLKDTLSADFTGYAYVSIDLESFVVDSVVYCESYDKGVQAIHGASGVSAFCDVYQKNGNFTSGTTKQVYGCKNIYVHKDDYEETGTYLGFYPYMESVSGEYTIKTDKFPSIKA